MTAGPLQARPCTPAEYFRLDRADEWKNEYRDGQIRPMPRVSINHIRIVGNLGGELNSQLRDSPCEVYVARMRVHVSRTGLYTYPDVVVACPPIRFEDAEVDTLLNPAVIVEVLSPSTEAYDRGEKFRQYRRLESLREYVLVAQDAARIERYVRQGDLWVLSEVSGLDAVLVFETIGCRVNLSDVYEKVQLLDEGQPVAPDDEPPPSG